MTAVEVLASLDRGSQVADSASWPVVVASLSLVALAVGMAGVLRLGLTRSLVSASVRAAVQLIAVGLLFVTVFRSDYAMTWAWLWVSVMIVVASATVIRRLQSPIDRLWLVTTAAIAMTTAVSLAVTFGFGVIDYTPVSVAVIAGITIGNTVPSAVLAVNQAAGTCRDRIGELEAMLALGLDRRQVLAMLAPRAAQSSLIPQIERTRTVGIIALPGAMTGLLLAGVEPIDAAAVQLLVMYLILGATSICVVGVVAVIVAAAVTDDLGVAGWVRSAAIHG